MLRTTYTTEHTEKFPKYNMMHELNSIVPAPASFESSAQFRETMRLRSNSINFLPGSSYGSVARKTSFDKNHPNKYSSEQFDHRKSTQKENV